MRKIKWNLDVNNASRQRVEDAIKKNLCVACLKPFSKSKVVRGCHERCYRATVRAVERGDFTEQSRIDAGKLLPPRSGGGRPTNPVTVEARQGESKDASDVQADLCNCGGESEFDLDFYLRLIQSKIVYSCGVTIDLEDLIWHFLRFSDRDMSICVEVIVETANNSKLLDELIKSIIFDEPFPTTVAESREDVAGFRSTHLNNNS